MKIRKRTLVIALILLSLIAERALSAILYSGAPIALSGCLLLQGDFSGCLLLEDGTDLLL